MTTRPAVQALAERIDHRHPPTADGGFSMASPNHVLPFEKEIHEMETLLARMEANADGQGGPSDEVRRMRREVTNLIRKIYNELTPWETVLVSRHPNRPQTCDYLAIIFHDFLELPGDRSTPNYRPTLPGS